MSADPTRCPHCGVALHGYLQLLDNQELDTGEEHTAERCRDYLVAEIERTRARFGEVQELFEEAIAWIEGEVLPLLRARLEGIQRVDVKETGVG